MGKKTYEEYLNMVRRTWSFLKDVPEEMQTDEVIDAAMGKDKWAFKHIKDDRMKTYDRCLDAVRRYWWLIEDVPDCLKWRIEKALRIDKKTYQEYLEMVRFDGWNLCKVPKKMQTDEIIDTAMSDLYAFWYIKDEKRKTFERCFDACNRYWRMLEYVPEEMQTDEVIDAAMSDNVWAVRYIKDKGKRTFDRCLRAVKRCDAMIMYVPEELKEIVLEEVGNG